METKRILVFIFILVASLYAAKGSVVYSKQDSLIYESYVKDFTPQQDIPINQLIVNTAKYFLGKPYAASTLESEDEEKLIINLREFDCTTFVENCIVLSRVIKSGDFSFSHYCQLLKQMRYRSANIDGYTSRMHYTTDWIYENEKLGILENISLKLEGERRNKSINYMTKHPQFYRHLKNDPINLNKLKKIEDIINKRGSYSVIPIEIIPEIEDSIQNGDIIVFATSIEGLDYSHVGIAYRADNNLRFIHASSQLKKVVIEQKLLIDYCKNSKVCNGISVLRINGN